MSRILHIANPFHRAGLYFVPHLLVAATVLLIVFALGFFAGSSARFTPGYYAHRYQAPLTVPTTRERVSPPTHANALPSTGTIHLQYFTVQTNQQGVLGSCQAWTFTKLLSYAFNWNVQPNGLHYHRFYSPRFPYDVVSNGQDAGSYLEQYPPVVDGRGIPRWIEFPYGSAALTEGFQAYVVDYPIPPVVTKAAAAHHLSVSEQPLFQYPGAGQGGVDLIRAALATHHAVNLDFPVYPEYDQANADGSTVVPPQPGESSRGGHANTAVKYDDTHQNPDGTRGAVLASNQWGPQAGVGADGIRHSGNGNGYVWMSYSFIRQYVFGAAVIHVARSSSGIVRPSLQAGKPLSADGGNTKQNTPPYTFQHGPTIPPPPHASLVAPGTITTPGQAAQAGYAWHVKNVELTDATDASALVNQWGDYFHIWPLGIAATIGTESGYNPRAYRWQAGLDKSCGLMQLIVTNVEPVIHSYDPFAACQWEYSAANSIWLGARYYRDAFAYQRGCVQFPQAYGLYNAGYAWPCSFYYNLTGLAYSNYVANFLPNYSWALQHFQDFGPGPKPKPTPKPKPVHRFHFNRPRWCRAERRLHRHCPSSYAGVDRLSTIAFQWSHWHHAFHRRGTIDHVCGGVIAAEHWNPKARVIHQRFSKCIVYEWPHFSGVPTRWHHAPRWRRGMKT